MVDQFSTYRPWMSSWTKTKWQTLLYILFTCHVTVGMMNIAAFEPRPENHLADFAS